MADIFNTTQKICTEMQTALDSLKQIRAEANAIENDTKLSEDEKKRETLRVNAAELDAINLTSENIDKIANEAVLDESERLITAKQTARLQTAQHLATVANALKFVELLGDDLTVEQIAAIIEPIKAAEDWRTLNLIRAIVRKFGEYNERATSIEVWGEDPAENIAFIQKIASLAKSALTRKEAIVLLSMDIKEHFEPTVQYIPAKAVETGAVREAAKDMHIPAPGLVEE